MDGCRWLAEARMPGWEMQEQNSGQRRILSYAGFGFELESLNKTYKMNDMQRVAGAQQCQASVYQFLLHHQSFHGIFMSISSSG
jgi:hypothetical protein